MNLKEKTRAMALFAWNDLRHAAEKALKTNEYKDFEETFDQVRKCERLLKAVRAQVRVHMRKTKPAFQAACPHEHKVDTDVRQAADGKRVVDWQRCTNCSKAFDLREKVS